MKKTTKRIRNMAIALTCASIGLIVLGLMESWAQGYTVDATCISCDTNLTCQFKDSDNNVYTFDNCYFMAGEPVILQMHDNYTPADPTDDIVMDVTPIS